MVCGIIGKPIHYRKNNSEPHNHKRFMAPYFLPYYEGINKTAQNVQTNEHYSCIVYFAVEYLHCLGSVKRLQHLSHKIPGVKLSEIRAH